MHPLNLQGHRASVLFSMLGQTLVFETLRDAEEYKEFLSQARTGGYLSFCCAWLPLFAASLL